MAPEGTGLGGFVDIKINAAQVYFQTVEKERKWARKNRGCFSVFFSSSTDPWQPVERKVRLTRRLLDALQEVPPDRLILQTHSNTILDDLGKIQSLSEKCDLRVHVSVEGDRDRLPGLPSPPCSLEERMEVLKKFTDRGIETVACLSPLYPMKAPDVFFSKLANMRVSAVVIDHFIQGDGTEDGSRTLKTKLPNAMAEVEPRSVDLSYRDHVTRIAGKYLPVGISASGFAGNCK